MSWGPYFASVDIEAVLYWSFSCISWEGAEPTEAKKNAIPVTVSTEISQTTTSTRTSTLSEATSGTRKPAITVTSTSAPDAETTHLHTSTVEQSTATALNI